MAAPERLQSRATERFLGLELSGAKNDKTTLAVLEFFPREKKIFLLEILEGIGNTQQLSSDEHLVELISQRVTSKTLLAVNVPTTFPPAFLVQKKTAQSAQAIRWMKDVSRKNTRSTRDRRADITPYTQRPVELWLKYEVIPELPEKMRFEIDEALGGSRAPLTARMAYLTPQLPKGLRIVEALPKLTVALLGKQLGIPARLLQSYRQLEEGAYARSKILDWVAEKAGLFIYDRDLNRMAQNLGAFDAFMCAITAHLEGLGQTQQPPKGFPLSTGWVTFPRTT